MSEEKKPFITKDDIPNIWIIALSITLGIICLFTFHNWAFPGSWSGRGPIGDYFNGVLAPFLQLATLILIFKTYRLQKKELNDTTATLKDQTNELISQNTSAALRYFLDKWFEFQLEFREANFGVQTNKHVSREMKVFEKMFGNKPEIGAVRKEFYFDRIDSNLFGVYIRASERYATFFCEILSKISDSNQNIYMDILKAKLSFVEIKLLLVFTCTSPKDIAETTSDYMYKFGFISEQVYKNLPVAFQQLHDNVFLPMHHSR